MAKKRATKPVPEEKKSEPKPDSSNLVWNLQEDTESWSTADVYNWTTMCKTYRVSRVECKHEPLTYFGACLWDAKNPPGSWLSIEYSLKEGPGYPKRYPTLEAAVFAAENHAVISRRNPNMQTNGKALVDYAISKGLAERDSKTSSNTSKLRRTAMKVSLPAARSLLVTLGFANAATWSEKKILDKLNDPDTVGSCKVDPDGEDLKTFRIVSKSIQLNELVELGEGSEAVEAKKAEKKEKRKENAKSRPKPARPVGRTPSNGQAMSSMDAAYKVLSEAKKPLNSREIVEAAASKGYWSSPSGKTPWNTLSAAIGTEIKEKGAESRFARPEPGKFTAVKVKK